MKGSSKNDDDVHISPHTQARDDELGHLRELAEKYEEQLFELMEASDGEGSGEGKFDPDAFDEEEDDDDGFGDEGEEEEEEDKKKKK